jgi:hypothetical protein
LQTAYERLQALSPEIRAMEEHASRDEFQEDVRSLRDEFGSQVLGVQTARSYERHVTERMVRTCWEDFSKLEDEIRTHLNSAQFD